MTSFGDSESSAWTWPALGIQLVLLKEDAVHWVQYQLAFLRDMRMPSGLVSHLEVPAVVTWSPSTWLALTWQTVNSPPTWLPSADYPKHNLWTNRGFLPGNSALTRRLLTQRNLRIPSWTSLTFTTCMNCSHVQVKILHTAAKGGGFPMLTCTSCSSTLGL